MLYEKDLTDKIIGAALEVHRTLGPGLLESTYAACLAHELTLRGLPFEKEKARCHSATRTSCSTADIASIS
jgi:GxxExxY protein